MLGIFDCWFYWIAPFMFFTAIGLLIHLLGRRPGGRPAPGRDEAYTCGEKFPVTDVGHENFYRTIKRVLELSKLRHAHTGRLSDYLLMILVGFVAVLIMVMMI